MYTKGSEVHPGTPWIWRLPDSSWPRTTCSFCGGLNPEEVVEMLNSDIECAGSDWKNSWPHKFYFWANGGTWKFYSEHLTELKQSEFDVVTSLISKHLNITFKYDEVGAMMFTAPWYNYKSERHSTGTGHA